MRLTLADMMRYIAPYNDYASLRAPLTLQAAGTLCTPGAYSWFHDCVPIPAKTSTATRSPHPWLSTIGCRQNVPEDRAIVPIGFSQGGSAGDPSCCACIRNATRASISLSGFLAPGARPRAPRLPTTVSRRTQYSHVLRLRQQRYGDSPSRSFSPSSAWLDEHTFLTAKSYRGLDHSVSLDEFSDLRGLARRA